MQNTGVLTFGIYVFLYQNLNEENSEQDMIAGKFMYFYIRI